MIKSEPIESMEYEELHGFLMHVQGTVRSFKHQHPFIIICLLDCCRTYCLRSVDLDLFVSRSIDSYDPKLHKNQSIIRSGSLIAFACSPGTKANDNKGQANGLFTKHLLKHIVTPNIDISKVLRAVNAAVIAESGEKQIPHYLDGLVTQEDIYLCEKSISK